eukprot:m.196884 g.196884  ORF g.196884 m.196884 type:complete len:328 (+) comp19927_c0_seq1:462-1445(+)
MRQSDVAKDYTGEWEYRPYSGATPSSQDGVDAKKEARYRREGCRFIKDVAQNLKLHMNVSNTGSVFFHRFYLQNSFKNYPRFYMAAACLFVAGKVEEQPKKLKDLLPCVFKLYPRKQQPSGVTGPNGELGQKMMLELKTQILANERALLQTLDFDLVVKHPPEYLFQFAKSLKLEFGEKIPNQLVQLAYKYINDSFQTLMCLEYRPEVLAVAHLHLAGTLLKLRLVVQPKEEGSVATPTRDWWEYFVPGCTEQMQEINHKTQVFYETMGETLQSTAAPALQALALTPGATPPATSPAPSASASLSASREGRRSSSSSQLHQRRPGPS